MPLAVQKLVFLLLLGHAVSQDTYVATVTVSTEMLVFRTGAVMQHRSRLLVRVSFVKGRVILKMKKKPFPCFPQYHLLKSVDPITKVCRHPACFVLTISAGPALRL